MLHALESDDGSLASDARNAIGRKMVGRDDRHDENLPNVVALFYAWEDQSIMTLVKS